MPEKPSTFVKTLLVIAFIAAIGGYAIYSLLQNTDPKDKTLLEGSSLIGTERAIFALPDLEGKRRNIREWDGKVMLLNFWATWCPPCLSEMPGFIELREKYASQGFEIVGIAIDKVEAVRDFAARLGVNYPVLLDKDNAVAQHYGNSFGVLPYSVLIDRDGTVRFLLAGELHKEDLEKELQKLL